MTARKNQVRLALEHLEDRCTPSTLGVDLMAPVSAPNDGPRAATVAQVRAAKEHVIPIKLHFQCSADLSTMKTSAAGFATHVGNWTGQGRLDSGRVDPVADRAEISGTFTVVSAKGDKLFVSFSTSWQLSTGKGTESITITGGTGRFAGTSGNATLACTISAGASPNTFGCNCKGNGILVLARR